LQELNLGEPVAHLNLTMFPLLAESSGKRGYLVLDEAMRSGVLRISEVSDSGSVPELIAENTGDMPVLLMDGEHLVGAKQNRILNISLLIPPHQKVMIPVACVEQGRWSPGHGEFAASREVLFARSRAGKASQVSEMMKTGGRPMADQGAIWDDMERKLDNLGARSSTSAMSAAYEEEKRDLDAFVRALEPERGQVGAVFCLGGEILGMDLFDHEEMLRLLLPKLVRSAALDAVEPGVAVQEKSTRKESIADFLKKIGEARWLGQAATGLGEWARIDSRELAGGALIYEKRVVHMFVARLGGAVAGRGAPVARFGCRGWSMPAC